jgi:hypothetical protein
MSLTKNVNYIQNIPTSLGYNNEISGATGLVEVFMRFNPVAGKVVTESFRPSSLLTEICDDGASTEPPTFNILNISGTQGEVNEILNSAQWSPGVFPSYNKEQDPIAVNREYDDFNGELLVETTLPGSFAIGDTFKLVGATTTEFIVSRVETTKSQYRVWGIPVEGQKIPSDIAPYDYSLMTEDDVLVDYIVDFAISNPAGTFPIEITATHNNGVALTSGITTVVGDFFVGEPYFSTKPPPEIVPDGGEWFQLNLGEVTQPDNDMVEVQILMKKFPLDPTFDGDELKNKPSYITDNSYACLSTVQVLTNRGVLGKPGEEVRWRFYGTPAECNAALSSIRMKLTTDKEFLMETRVINGRSRIYNTRGIY